jgi:hypothetical protein
MTHQAVGPTIGIAETEIEIAADSDAETNEEQRQADEITARSEQARAVPIQQRDGEGQHHADAKQAPEGQAPPAARLGRGPDAEGRGEQSAQQ